jgi:hypothetical protein
MGHPGEWATKIPKRVNTIYFTTTLLKKALAILPQSNLEVPCTYEHCAQPDYISRNAVALLLSTVVVQYHPPLLALPADFEYFVQAPHLP